MTPTQVIAAKRDGQALSETDIQEFIAGFVSGEVADYQMSAFAMAVYFQGMTAEETVALTRALLGRGETLEWTNDSRPLVDKHSTGGIGDKVSLVLAPLLACFDLQVPMISGRGLGPTGGTLDKVEAIPGFRTSLSTDELQEIARTVGCVIAGASADLAPADRKLYALRDVTGTVASQPLIVSSILSKKLAENLDSLVLDVKAGSGAFMKSLEDAKALGRALVDVGRLSGMKTSAMVTNMEQPLGRMIGNAVEVQESIDTLRQGNSSADLLELTVHLGSELLQSQSLADNEKQAHRMLLEKLRDGSAFAKFEEMVAAQGGNLAKFVSHELTPVAVCAETSGFVHAIDGQTIGNFVIQLGGGRQKVTDKIDHAVGLDVPLKVGHQVEAGQPLAHVYARGDFDTSSLMSAFTIHESPTETLPLIYERIG